MSMKHLILSIFIMSLVASDEGNDLYIYGLSYHSNRDYPFHEINPGLGIGHYWIEKDVDNLEMAVECSIYRNSYANWTGVATFGPRVFFGNRKDINVFVALNAGFTYSEDYTNLIMLPTGGIGYDRFSVNFVFIPKTTTGANTGNDSSNAIGMFLGYKF